MRKLMWFTVGFIASCAVGVYLLSGKWAVILALLAIVVAVVLCCIRTKSAEIAAAVLFGFVTGTAWLLVYDSCYLQTARQYDGKIVSATIEIADYSYDTQYGIAADGRIKLDDKTFQVRTYVNNLDSLSPGDTISGEFKLRFTAEGGEQDATYHPGKGIFLLAYEREAVSVHYVDSVPGKYFAAELRKNILDILDSTFPGDTLGFARALLLGDSSKLTYDEDTAFKVSGIRHIIAVSGLHVSILFALVYMLCGKHRVLTAAIGLPALLLFAAVAGFTPSVTRACIMQSLMILSMLFKKEYDPPTALAFAVLVILMVNPLAITSVSLQLSAGCIAGIFMFSKRINDSFVRLLGAPKGTSVRARLTRWLTGSVSVTLSAMVVTTPLCAYYFGMVSIVGVLTNLLTLWIVSCVFYGIMLSCILGALWLPIGKFIASIISWLIRFVLLAAKVLSSIPVAAVYTCSIYILIWLIASYVLLAIFLFVKKKHPVVFTACVVGCLCVALAASYIEPRLDSYRVTVLDVGQGQSILLQAGDDRYLVDCGGDNDKEAADAAAELLLSQGVTKLDGLIVTHYDSDHAGGVPYLLSRISVDTIYLPDIRDDGDIKAKLVSEYPGNICWVKTNQEIEKTWGKLNMFPGNIQTDENESGLCILFQPLNCDILITGDRNSAGERALLESTDLPELELLVVGHHGSKSSTSFELLSSTHPETAVISVGQNNSYGHPAAEVLDRLKLFGCTVFRTDLNGTIIYRG